MIRILQRLAGMAVTLVVSSFIIFAAMHAAPGDPVTFLVGNPENATPERIASVREEYHLDQPVVAQYALWLTGVLRGDLGTSFHYLQPVSDLMTSRLPNTLWLVAYASILFVVLGIALGIVSAMHRGRKTDSAITGTTTLAASIPSFVIGLILVYGFAVKLGWFPVTGGGNGFTGRILHMTLPAISLSAGALAIISRVTRQSMAEQFDADHVEAARSFGLATRKVIGRHVLRNAWGPILTMAALVIASMLAGTVVIEGVFGISGVGALLVDAINTHDFPVVQAVLLYMVISYMMVTTLVDLVHPLLDPRIRTRARQS